LWLFLQEMTTISSKSLIGSVILFGCRDAADVIEEIASMPEQSRYGVNRVVDELRPIVNRGLKAVLLFGVPSNLPKVTMLYSVSLFIPV